MYAGVAYAGASYGGLLLHRRRPVPPIRVGGLIGGSGMPRDLLERLDMVKVPRRREHILALREDEEALLNV